MSEHFGGARGAGAESTLPIRQALGTAVVSCSSLAPSLPPVLLLRCEPGAFLANNKETLARKRSNLFLRLQQTFTSSLIMGDVAAKQERALQ